MHYVFQCKIFMRAWKMGKNGIQKNNETLIRSALDRPIALVGMMGAGKSHLGKLLAERLGFEFTDTDAQVEAEAGLTVSEIFELYGENRFRQAEKNAVAAAVDKGPCVVATGGGALTLPETLEFLKRKSWMVWLDVDSEILWRRIKNAGNRPLLKTGDPRGQMESLMETRKPLYEQAHIRIAIDDEGEGECLERIIRALSETINEAKFRP